MCILSCPVAASCWSVDGDLWLLRDWQDGISYDLLLRQKRFRAAEVLTLLRQILPVLELLHGSGLVHGDVNPAICCAEAVMACLCCWMVAGCSWQGTSPDGG